MYGTFALPESGPVQAATDTNWTVVGTDDFDADGRCDILWRNQVDGKNAIWLMDGTTVLSGSGYLQKVGDTNWAVVGTGDFNGDGRSDILWRDQITGKNAMWLMDGTTMLPESDSLQKVADTNWTVAGTGDFDGDGWCDILWRHRVNGRNAMWLMDGTTVLPGSDSLQKVADTDWTVAGTRDFDGDGRSDILWHHEVTGNNAMWLMDGTTVLPASGSVQSFPDTDWTVVATSE
jgi:hypothetical protein